MGKGRAPCCDKSKVKRGPWSSDEDLKLITFIQHHGHQNWRSLPKQAGLLRCGKSCRLRWINYLRPDLKRGNFTKEEEDNIIKLHTAYGNKWSKIASLLPGRTDNEIKNLWNTHLKKRVTTFKESKETSTTSSASSSTSSVISNCKRNIDLELDQGSAVQKPYEEMKDQKDKSSSSSCCESNIKEAEEEVNMAFEYDSDFWNMLELDNLDWCQSDEVEAACQSSNFGQQGITNNYEKDENQQFFTKGTADDQLVIPEPFQYEVEWNPDMDPGISFSQIWPSPS